MRRLVRTNALLGVLGAALAALIFVSIAEWVEQRTDEQDLRPASEATESAEDVELAGSNPGIRLSAASDPEAVDSTTVATVTFRCIVTSDDGSDLVDATAAFVGPFGDAPATAVRIDSLQPTPDRVEFTFSVFPPTFSLLVESRERVPTRFSATEFANPTRTAVGVLERRRECTLEGRVIDSSGRPIASGTVTARALGSTSGWRFGKSVPLAQDGAFGFRDVPSGQPIVLSFVGHHFVHEPIPIRALDKAEARRDIVLTASETTSVRCLVVDSRDKTPISGAWVFQRGRVDTGKSAASVASSIATIGPRQTGDDGGADVVVIRGRSTHVEVRCPGYETASTVITEQLANVTVELVARRMIDVDVTGSFPCEIPGPAVAHGAHPIAASGLIARPGTAMNFVLQAPDAPDRDLEFDWVVPLRSARVEVGTIDPGTTVAVRLGSRVLATRSLYGVALGDRLAIQLDEANFCARGALRLRLVFDDGTPYLGVVTIEGRIVTDHSAVVEERSGSITLTPSQDGSIELTRLPEANYAFTVSAADRGIANLEREFVAQVVAGTTTQLQDIELARAGRVEVLTQTDDDADALVSITIDDGSGRRVSHSIDGVAPRRLSAGVPCVLSDVPIGVIRLVARADGYATAMTEVAVLPDDMAHAGVRLSRGHPCVLRIPSVTLGSDRHWWIRSQSAESAFESGTLEEPDSTGIAVLELRLEDGSYLFEVEGPRGERISEPFTVAGPSEIVVASGSAER